MQTGGVAGVEDQLQPFVARRHRDAADLAYQVVSFAALDAHRDVVAPAPFARANRLRRRRAATPT